MSSVEINELVGKTFTKVINSTDEALIFESKDDSYSMHHRQDCCESVSISEIHGDLADLANTPILSASEDVSSGDGETEGSNYGSHTWTFYNIRTIKGSVTIRWYGSSNGYYSESVGIYKIG